MGFSTLAACSYNEDIMPGDRSHYVTKASFHHANLLKIKSNGNNTMYKMCAYVLMYKVHVGQQLTVQLI